MSKRMILVLAVVLCVGLFAFSPALGDGHESCGGQYHAAVEGRPGRA